MLFLRWALVLVASAEMEDIYAALGEELAREDCSLLKGDCEAAAAFLQTKSAYRSLSAPSFFQMGEEVASEVGVVHKAVEDAKAAEAKSVEVRVDRSRQWQEEAIEVYTESHETFWKVQSFLSSSGLWLLLIGFVLLIATWVLWPQKPQLIPRPEHHKLCAELRDVIQETPLIQAEQLPTLLPEAVGYDCALKRPTSSGPVRFLARIEGPLPGGPPPLGLLRAPLSQRSCVYYSCSAKPTDGEEKKVVEHVDFQVSLVGGPSLRVDVMGRDLTLLDALEGHWTPPQADAPGPWRDFASGPGPCRFREDVLLVGSQVLLCGELLRDPQGRIFLQPLEAKAETWRTSWESLTPSTAFASNDITLARAKEELLEDVPTPFLML